MFLLCHSMKYSSYVQSTGHVMLMDILCCTSCSLILFQPCAMFNALLFQCVFVDSLGVLCSMIHRDLLRRLVVFDSFEGEALINCRRNQ